MPFPHRREHADLRLCHQHTLTHPKGLEVAELIFQRFHERRGYTTIRSWVRLKKEREQQEKHTGEIKRKWFVVHSKHCCVVTGRRQSFLVLSATVDASYSISEDRSTRSTSLDDESTLLTSRVPTIERPKPGDGSSSCNEGKTPKNRKCGASEYAFRIKIILLFPIFLFGPKISENHFFSPSAESGFQTGETTLECLSRTGTSVARISTVGEVQPAAARTGCVHGFILLVVDCR